MSHPSPPHPFPAQPPPPPSSGDTVNKVLGWLLGILLIGPALAIAIPVAAIATVSSTANGDEDIIGVGLVAGLVLPLLLPVPLLFFRRTRPWGGGILVGAALTLIVVGGSCALIIYEFNQSHAMGALGG